MQVKISIRHGHVSEPTQAALREKAEKLTRLYDRISAIEITVDVEHRELPRVDLKVTTKKHEFVATEQAENLLGAFDVVVERMEQQIRKHKEKVQDRHRGVGHHEEEVPE
ncbi:MAG: ribosome-associated translation inhibitor RaiA [Thermoguttaceae bacterium]